MWRVWLIAAWFIGLVVWNLPPGWSATSDNDMLRLSMAVLDTIVTPSTILLSIAVIVLILTVNFQLRSPY